MNRLPLFALVAPLLMTASALADTRVGRVECTVAPANVPTSSACLYTAAVTRALDGTRASTIAAGPYEIGCASTYYPVRLNFTWPANVYHPGTLRPSVYSTSICDGPGCVYFAPPTLTAPWGEDFSVSGLINASTAFGAPARFRYSCSIIVEGHGLVGGLSPISPIRR